jgi:spectinomycin phosphotransferase
MREPPVDLADEQLRASLHTRYGLAVTELTFLPLGHDSSAWVYRVRTTDGTSYFLKVRRRVVNEPRLLVPRYLHDQGVAQVIAPLPTTTQALWTAVDGYALILYPFVEGTSGKDQGMTRSQWIAYGTILRQIHAATLPPDLAQLMPRETFVPEGAGLVRDLEAHLGGRTFADPTAQALATFWHERRDEIHTLVRRAEELGLRLAERAPAFMLCHADIHTANVLLDAGARVWIVDWDETVLAPKERDLMFVVGGGISDRLVGPREEEWFFQGYGATPLDPLALAYYRYAWAVSDISEFGAQVFFRPDLGEVTKHAAADQFISLFQPGQIVAKAFGSLLPP